jgi:DNA-binding CsgD family transcriptional regulator
VIGETGANVTKAARSSTQVTVRQRQVVALVARGLTTKEIAHELRITERGVSAHISRLLAKFRVPNRAGLVAMTISDLVSGTSIVTSAASGLDSGIFPAAIPNELDGFKASKFLVTVTLGRDPVFAFMNDTAARFMDVDARAIVGVRVRERFADPSIAMWLERSDQAFRTGVPVSMENVPSRWRRDDGTWTNAYFHCVLQPVRDVTGRVNGVLWICAAGSGPSFSARGMT